MKKIIIFLLIYCSVINIQAQEKKDSFIFTDTGKIKAALYSKSIKSEKEKSGNTKDVLQNLYQIGLRNIFNNKGEFTFSSTAFGLLSKINTKIESQSEYSKYRTTRNISFNVSGKLDSSSSKVESFGAGFKIALLNRRDATKFDENLNKTLVDYESKIGQYRKEATLMVLSSLPVAEQEKKKDDIDSSMAKFLLSKKVEDLDKEFLEELKVVSKTKEPEKIFLEPEEYINKWRGDLNQKALITFGYNYYHNIILQRDTSAFQLDYVKGIFSNKETDGFYELNLSGSYKICNNVTAVNIMSKLVHIEAGLNKSLTKDENEKSAMELKVFGAFDKDFNLTGKGIFTANATYRYKVLKDFWIPITIKYDPDGKSLFGYVSLTFNIDKYSKN